MFTTVNENKINYSTINSTDYITNNKCLTDGILIKSQSKISSVKQETYGDGINDVTNKTLYTNTTKYEAIVNVQLSVVYDIVCVTKNSGLIVGDRFVSLNPLVNTITFTGTFKVQPQDSLKWSMIHYSATGGYNTDSTDDPISIDGSIYVTEFLE